MVMVIQMMAVVMLVEVVMVDIRMKMTTVMAMNRIMMIDMAGVKEKEIMKMITMVNVAIIEKGITQREHRCAIPIFSSLVLGVTSALIDTAAFGVLSIGAMLVASNMLFVATNENIALVSYCVCSKKIH